MQFQHIFSAAGDDLLELLQGLFHFDPCTRFTASQVINLPYKLLLVCSKKICLQNCPILL